MTLEPVIGLEVHVQLKTESKLFCRCSTAFGAEPNSPDLPDLLRPSGRPAVLEQEGRGASGPGGAGVGCEIAPHSIFARKQYFYPDLPKAYQISQYDLPLAVERQSRHHDARRQAQNHPHPPHPPGRRRRQTPARDRRAGTGLFARGSEPRRRPAGRMRFRAGSCEPRKKPTPISRRSKRSSSIWTFPTATWKRAPCAATPTSPCGPSAISSLGPKPKSKI